jgi:hypothetical protein
MDYIETLALPAFHAGAERKRIVSRRSPLLVFKPGPGSRLNVFG